MSTFPFYKQPDIKDCGPTCLRIIAKHYGKSISLQEIRALCETTRSGSNLLKLSEAAETMGFRTLGARLNFNKLKRAHLPVIVHWRDKHFVVVYKIKGKKVFMSDPAYGLVNIPQDEFITHWVGKGANQDTKEGVTLLLETSPNFKSLDCGKRNLTSMKI